MKNLEDKPPRISDESYDVKVNELIEIYKSQSFIKEMFPQMFPYEDWTLYDNTVA